MAQFASLFRARSSPLRGVLLARQIIETIFGMVARIEARTSKVP